MTRYDAVVVGAGPGGAAAAAHLARAGLSVLLLDRSSFPRDKACGGGLTPRGVAALERLGVSTTSALFTRVAGVEMRAGGRESTAAFPATRSWPRYGSVARRIDLDAAIVDVATKSGARFCDGVRVLGPVMEDGRCRGVRIMDGTAHRDIFADHTIAADGATSVMARAAGLADSVGSGRGFWYAAMRGYLHPVEPRVTRDGPMLEFYPLRTADGRYLPAYGWVFPLPGGTANVGVDVPHSPKLAGCPPLRDAYERFVAGMRAARPGFAQATHEAPPVGALLPEAMRGFRPGAPGLLSVGDAAGLITPYSGEGIVYALESAEIAAATISQHTRPSAVLDAYGRALWETYGFQFRAALGFMKAMRRPALARAAAWAGIGHQRPFRAAVRVMTYLIDDDTTSTTSTAWRTARAVWNPSPGSLWS